MLLEEVKKAQDEFNQAFEAHKKANDERLAEIEKKGTVDAIVKEKAEKAFDSVMELKDKLELTVKEFNTYVEKNKVINASSSEKKDMYSKYLKLKENGDRVGDQMVKMFFTEENDRMVYDEAKARGYEEALAKSLATDNAQFINEYCQKSLNVINDSSGGFLVSPMMGELIATVAREYSPIHQDVDSMEIMGDSIIFPTHNNTAGASRQHELATRSETDTPTFGGVEVKPEDLYAEPHVSQRMLDVRTDIETWLSEMIGLEFVIKESSEMMIGNGIGGCRGMTTYPNGTTGQKIEQITSGHATQLNDFDKVKDLVAALKKQYRNGAKFHATRATFNVIGKLKDGEGQYLWRPNNEAGAATTLLGYQIEESEDVPEIGAGAVAMLFGNFKRAYKFVSMPGIRVIRDQYTKTGFVKFKSTKRSNGRLVVGEALKALVISA